MNTMSKSSSIASTVPDRTAGLRCFANASVTLCFEMARASLTRRWFKLRSVICRTPQRVRHLPARPKLHRPRRFQPLLPLRLDHIVGLVTRIKSALERQPLVREVLRACQRSGRLVGGRLVRQALRVLDQPDVEATVLVG